MDLEEAAMERQPGAWLGAHCGRVWGNASIGLGAAVRHDMNRLFLALHPTLHASLS